MLGGRVADVTGTVKRDPATDRPRSIRDITSVELVDGETTWGIGRFVVFSRRENQLKSLFAGCAKPNSVQRLYLDANVLIAYLANDADIEALREAGFSDRDILDIVEVVAYYAYANRIADGLGLETEDWIPD